MKHCPDASTTARESVIAVLPGGSPSFRLVVARVWQDDGRQGLVLRHESQSADVGWFEQSRVAIDPEQFSQLQMLLSSAARRTPPTGDGNPPRHILPFPFVSQAG